jgi:hypothetical protein
VQQLLNRELQGRFPRTPARRDWEARLHNATSLPEDPCQADLLSTYGGAAPALDGGFNTLASDVAFAAYFSLSIAVKPAVSPHPDDMCHRTQMWTAVLPCMPPHRTFL